MSEYKHRIQGKINNTTGKAFETLIEASCRWYDETGRASIEKTPEPMRPIKRLSGGQFVAIFEKKAQPDFKGTLNGGRTIAFEAKYTDAGKIDQKQVTDEQWRRLCTLQARGALCFVLVCFSFESFCMIPWDIWREMKTMYGRKYLKRSEAEIVGQVRFDGSRIHFLDHVL